jgi:hypothetical protein
LVLHIGYIIGTYRLVDEALKSRIVVISAVVRIGDRVNSRAG